MIINNYRSVMFFRLLLAFTLSVQTSFGAGGSQKENTLSFHLQGHETDGPKRVFSHVIENERRFFQKTPFISTKDIIAYRPFISENGEPGAVFQFSEAASKRLTAHTTQNQGKTIIAMINGRPVDQPEIFVDQPIQDGKLVIWEGLKDAEMTSFELSLPHIGENTKQWKTRVKELKAALKERQNN